MRFSVTEKLHLLKAWVMVSLAFAIIIGNVLSFSFIIYFAISLVTVGAGFLLHEIAHKLVAQRYGCYAEFRSDDKMLVFAVLSAFFGVVFAAPGAVIIFGNISREKNGRISAAGPLANISLAILFFLLKIAFPGFGLLTKAFNYGFQINSFIGLFNMIPFLNFDGQKILRWSRPVYAAMVLVSLAFVILPRIFPLLVK